MELVRATHYFTEDRLLDMEALRLRMVVTCRRRVEKSALMRHALDMLIRRGAEDMPGLLSELPEG